ncbi:hypothetical protein IMZ38_05105 [Thermosphaera chiliense]|uniref:Uncharacterized protein n=1 Tax=Thermosphaera chiliense TaxID=3402707 RepID=A0A7M1USJ9_9CREN|nr:hypothetical protein [Thermosphaera aggregans]QOR94022.1 hypothetical protein IMZ38_05105 [Thermosphaera aggregans]
MLNVSEKIISRATDLTNLLMLKYITMLEDLKVYEAEVESSDMSPEDKEATLSMINLLKNIVVKEIYSLAAEGLFTGTNTQEESVAL